MNYNVKRWGTIQALRRKNLRLACQIKDYTKTLTDSSKIAYMNKLSRKLEVCSGLALYTVGSNVTKGITHYLCGEKICFVCNNQRQRSTRRKYFNWFNENQILREINIKGKKKIVTASQYMKSFASLPYKEVKYDVMHFTLTVPHTAENGYRGKALYYDEFKANMTALRSLVFWKKMVLGGEYGIETERKEKGAHIHVHGLMLVRAQRQNRNLLHRELLLNWNRISIDPQNTRKPFTDDQRKAIKNGNKLLTDADIERMDPKGATQIDLRTIYERDSETQKKQYITSFKDNRFLKGILEAIKYHFEPLFFDKGNKTFDLDMIAEIKPLIAGKPLYYKFGCLMGENSLNINADLKIEYADAAVDVDSETGEIINQKYFLVNPALMFNNEEKLIWSRAAVEKSREIKAVSTSHAVEILSATIKEAGKHGKLS